MRDGARIQEVIDIIDQYKADLGPLDEFVQSYLKQRRYIGSHDRRQINTDVFNIYRAFPCLKKFCEESGLKPLTGRALVLMYLKKIAEQDIETLFTGEKYQPAVLSVVETQALSKDLSTENQHYFPDWLYEKLSAVFKTETSAQLSALNKQATVDLCVNIKVQSREKVLGTLSRQGIQAENTSHSPLGIRIQRRTDLRQLDLFKRGIIDIQDEGAQLIGLLCDVIPGMTVCDYCAGAGGKTRTLSILLNNRGAIIATDSVKERIDRLQQRLKLGQKSIIKVLTLPEAHDRAQEGCDRVLLDVPCSGTGTLRRQPELKMTLSPEKINQYVVIQRQVLTDAVHLVKPKGYIIYATCSLLQEENEQQVEWFLAHNPNFRLIPAEQLLMKTLGKNLNDCKEYLRLSPYTHGTDGFFAAVFEKI